MGKKRVISEVIFKDKSIPPIILDFKNGNLKSEILSNSQCGIYRDNDDPEKYTVALCTPSKLLYMGKEPIQSHFRTMLAIQEQGSKKIRLVEADQVALQVSPISAPKSIQSAKSFTDLNKTFGSKRMIRQAELAERMKIDVETVKERLKETASAVLDIEDTSQLNLSEQLTVFIPYNREAARVEEVYNIWEIISEEELNSLNEEAEYIWNNLDNIKDHYSTFFCNCMQKIPLDDKLFRTKLLLYADCIITYLKMPHQLLRKKNPLVAPKSPLINNKILATFTEGIAPRCRTPYMRDKALSTVIVLGLIAMKFTLSIEPLIKEVNIIGKKLLALCRYIGAVYSPQDRTTVTLKLPLPSAPRVLIKLGKRKKNV